jgi:hypothetical protein
MSILDSDVIVFPSDVKLGKGLGVSEFVNEI